MRYLGIDPGTARIGYGVIEDAGGGSFRCLAYGILGDPGTTGPLEKTTAAESLAALIQQWSPDRAAVEKLFFFKNQKSVMSVSEMRGVIMLTLAQHSLPIAEFTPLQVKQTICGHGRAEKHQVQKMMRLLLKIPNAIRPDDAADALAMALCCAVAPKPY